MIPQEELIRTADRLTDALTAAAAVMSPEGARTLGSPEGGNALGSPEGANALGDPVPGRRTRPASRPVRHRRRRLRAWLVPVGAAASVTAIILTALTLAGHPETAPASGASPASGAGPASAPASRAGAASAPAPAPAPAPADASSTS